MPLESIGIFDILHSIGGWKLKAIKIFDLLAGGCLARILPRKPPSSVFAQPFKRILVIRPGGIGDAIFVLPFLRVIEKENPGIIIDVLCEQRNAQIFTSQKGICDGIFCYDRLSSFRGIWGRHYDVVVDTEQWHYLSALVCYGMAHDYSIGFASRPLRKKLFSMTVDYDLDAYEIENFKKLFLPVFPGTGRITDIAHSFILDETAQEWARKQVPDPFVTLFLGASIPLRRLSLNQSAEIMQFAFSKNLSVVLLGGHDVIGEAGRITENIADQRVINFVGKASLLQTAALIKRSRFFVGPDSGIMHLARAVGTPVIAIFGPGNLQKWGLKGDRDRVVTLNLPCSPCTRFGYTIPTCRGTYKCMRDIKLGDIDSLNDII
mgnify:CR=1 FL=1